ncbi:MAG: hypothetical protein HN509_18725 [Halobacteriovoraceae bacterium]|nr:hypothetical protein [Halobacteriovoraceae bacterium]MBT5095872.1 hypothetical protein [Halobacteriovoraceae bacterium]
MGTFAKRALTLILVFCLMHVQLSGAIAEMSFINGAYAQSSPTSESNNSAPEKSAEQAQATGAADSQLSGENADIMEKGQQAEKEAIEGNSTNETTDGKFQAEGKSSYITQQYIALLTMIAIAFVGLHLLKNCTIKTADIVVGAIGAVAFIVGELLSIFTAKGELDFETLNYKVHKDGKISGLQAAAIQAQIDSYKAAQKDAKTRMVLQGIATAAFLVATIIATAHTIGEKISAATITAFLAGGAAAELTSLAAGVCLPCATLIGEIAAAKCTLGYAACVPPEITIAYAANCTPIISGCAAAISAANVIWGNYQVQHELTYPSTAKYPTLTALLKAVDLALAPCTASSLCLSWAAPIHATFIPMAASLEYWHGVAHATCAPTTAVYNSPNKSLPEEARSYAGLNQELKKLGTTETKKYQRAIAFLKSKEKEQQNGTSTCQANLAQSSDNMVNGKKEFKPVDYISRHINPKMLNALASGKAMQKKKINHQKLPIEKYFAPHQVLGGVYHIKNSTQVEVEKLSISPEINNEKFHQYIVKREHIQFSDGRLSSLSIDQYEQFKGHFSPQQNVGQSVELNTLLGQAMSRGIDLFAPQAEAVALGTYGLAAVAIAIILALIPGQWQVIDNFITQEAHRIWVWGIFTVLTATATSMSSTIVDDMQANIDELEKLLAKLKSKKDGGETTPGSIPTPKLKGPAGPQLIPPTLAFDIAEDGTNFPCLENKNSDGTCPPIVIDSKKIGNEIAQADINFNGAAALTDTANRLSRFGNNIQGNDSLSGNDLNDAAGVNSNKSALNATLGKLTKKLDDMRRSEGKDPADFRANQNALLNQLKAATIRTLQKKGLSPRKALAGIGGVPESALKEGGDEVPKGNRLGGKSLGATFKVPNFGKLNFKAPKFKAPKIKGLDAVAQLEADNNTVKALEGYEETKASDIVEDSGASIWQILNFRYKKSAYPRLFKKKKKD